MSRAKQHLLSLLERYRHLQTQDIELVLKRIFDLGEDQVRVLSDLGISRDEISRITEDLRRISQSDKTTTHTGSQPKVHPQSKPLRYHTPSAGFNPLGGDEPTSISRQQALNQGMSPRKRAVGPISPSGITRQQHTQPSSQPSPVL